MQSHSRLINRLEFYSLCCLACGLVVSTAVSAGEKQNGHQSTRRSILWVKQAGGLKHDKIRAMTVDAAGNCYVTGEFTDAARFDDRNVTSRGKLDFVLVKYSPQGKLLWLQTAGGTEIDRGYAVAVDKAGNCYVTGHFESPTFEIGNITLQNKGDYDCFIAKFDVNGMLQWAQSMGGAGYDYGHGIAVNRQGDVYVSGSFAGEVTLGKAQSNRKRGRSLFIAKYTTDGKLLWSHLAGNKFGQSAHEIAVDVQGDCYVSGFLRGVIQLDGQDIGKDKSMQDIFVAKLTSAGKLVWAQTSGSNADGLSTAVAVDLQGNCYLTGMFKNEATFGNTTLKSSGGHDIFIARFNADGSPAWAYSGGGEKTDYGLAIATDRSGNCYITGEFTDDVKFAGRHVTNLGGRDLFIARFSPIGHLDWLETMGGDRNDLSYAIAVDRNNNCFLSGAFSPHTQYQSHKLKSRGSNDIFLIKLQQ